ncbi:MAG: ATP-binding cassette domain-containing protein [Bauldia sp.]
MALILHDVTLAIGAKRLVEGLTLSIAPGETVTVMGPSGAGKSSLLAFVSGTLDHAFTADGQVCLGDRDVTSVPPQARSVGILFQDDLLFPHLSVGGNIGFGLDARVTARSERRKQIETALAEAGLKGFFDRDPGTLSGGQRSRVALLRTLLANPRALLLDEPFTNLDVGLKSDFRQFVLEHARARRLPVLLVTHDPADAAAAGGPVVILDRAPARATKPAQAASSPANDIVSPKLARPYQVPSKG